MAIRKFRINPFTGRLDRVVTPQELGGEYLTGSVYDVDDDAIIDKAENVDDGEGNASTASQVKEAVLHKDLKNNPHVVELTDFGIATGTTGSDINDAVTHKDLTNNPHTVTVEQLGLATGISAEDINDAVAHINLTNNPHVVTVDQLDLATGTVASDVDDAVTKKHTQNTDTDLDATFEATFVKKVDSIGVLADVDFDTGTPADNYVLVYDGSTGVEKWKAVNELSLNKLTITGLGIGINTPADDRLTIGGNEIEAQGNGIAIWDYGYQAPYIASFSARGSVESPGAIADDDLISLYDIWAHDGTNFQNVGIIKFEVDGTVSTGIIPTRLEFWTTDTSGSLNKAGRFLSNGDLEVYGNLILNGTGNVLTDGVDSVTVTELKDAVTHKDLKNNPHNVELTDFGVGTGITGADIDDVISKEHEHSNKTELDKVTDGDHDVRVDNPHSVDLIDLGIGTGITGSDIDDAVSKKHTRSHAIDSASDHSSTITENNLMDADANGLPDDSGIAVSDVSDAVTKKHTQNADTDLDATFELTFVKKVDSIGVLADVDFDTGTPANNYILLYDDSTGVEKWKAVDLSELMEWLDNVTLGSDGKLTLVSGTDINEFSTDGTLAGDSDDAVPTEKAVKTYADTKSAKHISINTPDLSGTGVVNYTLVLTDDGKLVDMSDTENLTLTVPANASVAFPIGTTIALRQKGTGTVTITPVTGVIVDSKDGLVTTGQHAMASILKVDTDTWVATGALEA